MEDINVDSPVSRDNFFGSGGGSVTPVRNVTSNTTPNTTENIGMPVRGNVRNNIVVSRDSVTSTLGGGVTGSGNVVTSTGNTPQPVMYGLLSPFATLADVFNRTFANNSNPVNTSGQSSIVPVPVNADSGGNNTVIIIVILLAVAGLWYYYKG